MAMGIIKIMDMGLMRKKDKRIIFKVADRLLEI